MVQKIASDYELKDAQARNEERRKVRLEKMFRPVAVRLLNLMIDEFRIVYSATGRVPDLSSYAPDWVGSIKDQYRLVGDEFLNNSRKSRLISHLVTKQADDDKVDDAIMAAFILWSQRTAEQQAGFIIQTTLDEIRTSINDVRGENAIQADPEQLSDEDIADRAATMAKKKTQSRAIGISNMQTQPAAEEAKRLEATAVAGLPILPFQQVLQTPKALKKTWFTVGDEKVRTKPFSHREADGQMVSNSEPFIVGGQMLRYPGDTSLGATIGNVINCRCSAQYEF